MAGAAFFRRDSLNVLLVRHGESTNNVVYADVFGPVAGEPSGSEAHRLAEAQWLERRVDDPPLTEKGGFEAESLAKYAPWLAKDVGSGGRVRVFVSPFLRTCQTALPLVRALGAGAGCTAELRPDLFEVGGVYTVGADGRRGGPGQCLGRRDFGVHFPKYGTSLLAAPKGGEEAGEGKGWYTDGWETDASARERAKRVVAWLRSPALQESCANPHGRSWAVLVTHGHFIDMLVKALLGVEDDASEDRPEANVIKRAVAVNTPNTALGYFVVYPDGKVALQFLGRTDHLRTDAATLDVSAS